MIKGLEAITSPISSELRNGKQYYTYIKEDIEAIEKELKALEILKKYVSIEESNSDLFDYFIEDKQYVSNRSCNVITNKEYKLLKEVLK